MRLLTLFYTIQYTVDLDAIILREKVKIFATVQYLSQISETLHVDEMHVADSDV